MSGEAPPPSPDAARCRRFTLGDAMLLIAAGAVGLAMSRGVIVIMLKQLSTLRPPTSGGLSAWWQFLFGRNRSGPHLLALNVARFANTILQLYLPGLMIAAITIRLRRPRPPLRELWRHAGFAACIAPFVAFVPCQLVDLIAPGRTPIPYLLLATSPLLVWIALIATGARRVEPGWIDRLGRWVGGIVLVSLLANLLLERFLD